jgi:RNA polymerase sigma-70 factor (ECF subfamily)
MVQPDAPLCDLHQVGFTDVVLIHQTLIYNICFRILKNRQAADDATQETFISAWQHLDAWKGPARPWLVRIAVNKSYDELRRNARRKLCSLDTGPAGTPVDVVDNRPGPEHVVMDRSLWDSIEIALDQLPADQRIVVILSDVEGLEYREIASATRVSLGTVKSRLSRARSNLRRMLLGVPPRAYGRASGYQS